MPKNFLGTGLIKKSSHITPVYLITLLYWPPGCQVTAQLYITDFNMACTTTGATAHSMPKKNTATPPSSGGFRWSSLQQWSGRFLGIKCWDPSVCKSHQLHVNILRFSFIKLGTVYSFINPSKSISNFPAVLMNFNRLFLKLKLNRFICNC